jgi:hypothetical protein
MNAPPPPRSNSTYRVVAIVLIVLGILGLLVLGTCGVGVYFAKRTADRVAAELADGGGLVLVSPPAVKSELAGPKADYVGSWRASNGSELDIAPDGNVHYLKKDPSGTSETIDAPIASFRGDDIEIKIGISIWIRVSSPPHKVGARWEMTASGVTFEKK